jgi:DNA replication protein DnaC
MGRVRVEINGDKYEVFCHCQLEAWRKARSERWSRLSNMPKGIELPNFNDFEEVDMPDWAKMAEAIEAGKSLVESPLEHPWITIMGGNGCGKSMLLQSIYKQLDGYAAYLGAGRLGTMIFDSFQDNSTQDLMRELEEVSVLLIDDYGVENVRSETIRNRITEIIDRRYQYGRYRPTVIATNKTRKELRKQNNRVADRILDKNLAKVFSVTLPSFREDTQLDLPNVVRRQG